MLIDLQTGKLTSRRQMLLQSFNGLGGLALASLLSQDSRASAQPAKNAPHHPPKAKNCIFLFMSGGVSQVDTFENKPELQKIDGQRMPVLPGLATQLDAYVRSDVVAVGSPFEFRRYGGSGREMSTMFGNLGGVADELAFVHGIEVDSPLHSAATLHVTTGSVFAGNPSVGAWVAYGLGSENENLPGYMVLHDRRGGPVNGSAVWQSGYLPASYQGTLLRSSGPPILNLDSPAADSAERSRREFDLLRWTNEQHAAERRATDTLEARIAAYELAYRMQTHAPGVVDLSDEPASVQNLYGLDNPVTEPFGRQCLLARRLVERGVRYSLLVHGWENGVFSWDHHKEIRDWLPARAQEVDLPIAGLLQDLKSRGLLDQTLVVFTTEMSRTPFIARRAYGSRVGRDHHRHSMVTWFAGAGVRGGSTVGATDEFSLSCADEPLHVRDIHATILHLMGLDSDALTYLHEGRHKRLTDTGGRVLEEILA